MKQHYGGGGHVGAAGGTITEDKFIEILKKKKL
jgi:nanoRNase/pAp phosphatase (c-di-AMP/oligoRNAs hydrolase)